MLLPTGVSQAEDLPGGGPKVADFLEPKRRRAGDRMHVEAFIIDTFD